MPQHGRYGYLPRDPSQPAPELETYLTGENPLPQSPGKVDRMTKVTTWPMYRNNDLGDCVPAGGLHATSALTAFSGVVPGGAMFTDEEAVRLYSAISVPPFDPQTGNNDNGATLVALCQYMVATGVTDIHGRGHKWAAWAEIAHFTDLRLIKRIINGFGTVILAIQCPQSALDQFDAGEPWTPVPDSPIDGGHCIVGQYSTVNTGTIDDQTWITWGAEQKLNEAFAKQYLMEAVAVVSADDVTAQTGVNPVGLNLTQMIADCQSKYLV